MSASARRIEHFDAFRSLRPAWDELVEASRVRDACLEHGWFDAWIRAYAAEDRLALETLWRDGQLVAVAPLQRGVESFRGLRVRALEQLWSPVAPRSAWLASDPAEIDALVDAVVSRDDWDVLVIPQLAADEGTTGALIDAVRARRLAHQDAPGFRSPFLRVAGPFDEHLGRLPRERRRYLTKKCVNRLEREGDYAFGRIESDRALDAFLPEMYALSEKSWKAGVSAELRADSPVARLLVDFARAGLARGAVRLDTLRLHDRLIAFEYMLVRAGRYSVVRSDYDLDYRYFTPGNALRLHVLRGVFDAGACEYDLGGEPDPYKVEWCDSIRPHRSLTIGRGTWRAHLVLAAKNVLLPAMRRLRGGGDGRDEADDAARRTGGEG